jgi:hypothetical protein
VNLVFGFDVCEGDLFGAAFVTSLVGAEVVDCVVHLGDVGVAHGDVGSADGQRGVVWFGLPLSRFEDVVLPSSSPLLGFEGIGEV